MLRLLLAMVLLAPGAGAVADTLIVSPVAVQRETAPVGGRYVLFGDVSIDSLRRVTFTASLSRGQVGLFQTRRGKVVPLVLLGDPAPADAGASFGIPDEGASNARGDLAFIADVRVPSRAGVFLTHDGVTRTVALTGSPAPTSIPTLFAAFDQIFVLESGEVYFGALLVDAASPQQIVGRAIVRTGPAGLETVLAPGDRFGGTREIEHALQFDVNEEGEVVSLASVIDFDRLQPEAAITEILQIRAGRISTLASSSLSISGGVDQVRHLAYTFDQVHIDHDGAASFFASTTDFFGGAYFENSTARLFANHKIIGDGDPTPVSGKDKLKDLGPFDLNAAGTLAYAATTKERPAGGFFARRDGLTTAVALVGEPRPDGLDVWHGFSRVDLNERNAFTFTDFEDGLIQVGVFLGRYVPPPARIIDELRDLVRSPGVDPGVTASVTAMLDGLDRFLSRDHTAAAILLAEALRVEIGKRAGRTIPLQLADEIDLLLEDLIGALGGPLAHGPGGSRGGGGGDRRVRR